MAKSKLPLIVKDYIDELSHPLTQVLIELRHIILNTDPSIGEQIKWNSPSFYYTGQMKEFDPKTYQRDLVVMNLHKMDSILLVFPTGAKVKDKTGLLEGKYTDGRKIALFRSLEEVHQKKKDLIWVVKEWLRLLEK